MKTVFLDLDGTLTDPKIGITKSFIHELDKLDLPAPHMDELEWVIGPSLMDSFTRMQVPDPQVAIDLYRERYTAVGLFENSLYPGIIPVLEQLQGADYRMCLATAKPHAYALGDRHHDFDAARAVGMKAVAVTWGYGSAAEWATADVVCEVPQDLPAVIREILPL